MRSIIVRLSVIVVSVYLIVRLIGVLNTYRSSYITYKNELKKKEELEAIIEEDRALCDSSSRKKMIEKSARERFGLAYPNEEIYTDTSGN